MKRLLLIILGTCLASLLSLKAATLTVTVPAPPPAESGYFKFGTTRNPSGRELSVNSRSVLLDGKSWFPAMGEFHYSRCPQNEWRDELLKVKAGGVDIVATYVFWIHHEEIQGRFDWSGPRDLRQFVQLCGELGLKVVVRCGPWCHGEVRNGGLPDWVQAHDKKDWKLRSTDTNFLAAVSVLYGQIGVQLNGLLWKDGGPVIGIQVDNEFGGSPDYLMALKKIAIESGLDVPLYTKTGWPATRTPMPLGELLPLFGTYADGFWDRDLKMMSGDKWMRFVFSRLRTDSAIANDLLGNRKAADEADTEKYPYLTCEIGGGMETSYHRRILVEPHDIESVVLVQLGSGSSLLGYYMYHGGQNPEGKLTTLNESQATGYPNDLPVKDYDFQAPLGEYGQINPHYHWLRRLHLFLHDFGGPLAQMPVSLPDVRPTNRTDLATLRWAVRSDGQRGFVFVNNYQRLQPMPSKKKVQLKLHLPGGEFVFPSKPVTIPADSFFLWPFNLDLGGAKLIYATAQPICRMDDTFFFAETPGVKAEFVFDPDTLTTSPAVFRKVKPGRDAAIRLQTKSGAPIQIVLLNDADSLALWQGELAGRERVVLSSAGIAFAGDVLKVTAETPGNLRAGIFPALQTSGRKDGIFSPLDLPGPRAVSLKAKCKSVKHAGPLREIPRSTGKAQLALAPVESDFTNAAVWKIKLPADLDLNLDPILRIHYTGDVARLTLNGKLIDDNFYNGQPFDLGLKRFAPEVLNGDLRLEILPLCQDTPIYLAPEARPKFGKAVSMARVNKLEIVNRYQAEFKP
jgi:beta-galactosidase